MKKQEKEFKALNDLIVLRKNAAIGFLNYASVSTYWTIGAYISKRIKSSAWGSKTVTEFEDYLKTRNPKLRGFGRRQIYNMVEFYDTYSSMEFADIFKRLRLWEFVQSAIAQLPDGQIVQPAAAQLKDGEIVQLPTAQLEKRSAAIVQPAAAQFDDILREIPTVPAFLSLLTFTNHMEVLSYARNLEEKVFYILRLRA